MRNNECVDSNVVASAGTGTPGGAHSAIECVKPPFVSDEIKSLDPTKASRHLYVLFQGIPASVFFFFA